VPLPAAALEIRLSAALCGIVDVPPGPATTTALAPDWREKTVPPTVTALPGTSDGSGAVVAKAEDIIALAEESGIVDVPAAPATITAEPVEARE